MDSKKNLDQECKRLVILVGGSEITLTEENGQLVVFGDASDLLVQGTARNSFTVFTKDRF